MRKEFVTLTLPLVVSVFAGCGVDPRWGPRNETNPSIPGTLGVDSRWGEPRSGLREPLEWQYQSLPRDGTNLIK